MLQEGPRHLAGAQHDDLAAEPLGQLLRTLQAHPRLLAAQAAGIDVYHAPGQVPTFGDPAGVAHQAFGLFVTVDAHQQPPAQRRRFLAALAVAVVEVGVDRAAAVCIASSRSAVRLVCEKNASIAARACSGT